MDLSEVGIEVAELCVRAGLCKSKSEARRAIEQGAIKIDDKKVLDPFARLLFDIDNKKYYTIKDKQYV